MIKCELIAEIGWNHMGDMALAEEMIKEASLAGADYCKFQTWNVKNLKSGPWNHDGRVEIYKKAELSNEKHHELLKLCKRYNTKFLTSVFNINDLEFVSTISKEAVKIPSHEVYNLDLIKESSKLFNKIFVSVGACKWVEFEKILDLDIDFRKFIFMHCVSSYPLAEENVNFPKLIKIKKEHKNIGYSGHLKGIQDAIAAISLGVIAVEKHFTINNDLPGRDNKFALLPYQIKEIKNYIDVFYKMSQDCGLDIQECEMDIYNNYRGRWSKN